MARSSSFFPGRKPEDIYKPTEIYTGLRTQVLALQPDHVGATSDTPVLAVVMETGYDDAAFTLVSVVDGASSLYFTNGGGIIGSGQHPRANAVSREVVRRAESFMKQMERAEKFPLPLPGFTRFYVITPKGIFTAEAKEQDLGERRHALSPLFYFCQNLITEIRLVEEAKRKGSR